MRNAEADTVVAELKHQEQIDEAIEYGSTSGTAECWAQLEEFLAAGESVGR